MTTTSTLLAIGDSITNGVFDATAVPTSHGGWRGHLLGPLNGSGSPSAWQTTMVGRLSGPTQYGGHEGHNGWKIQDALNDLDAIFTASPNPTITTLDLGINDLPRGTDPGNVGLRAGAPLRLQRLGVEILRRAPETWLLVANLIPVAPTDIEAQTNVDVFNAYLSTVICQIRHLSGSGRVLFLDMAGGFNAATDLSDGVHPNDLGYQKMSAVIFYTVVPILEGTLQGAPAVFADDAP